MIQGRATRFAVMAVTVMGLALAGGCASKKYVNDGLATNDAKIADVESQVEANQRELRATKQRVDETSEAARSAQRTGEKAGQRAEEAFKAAQGKLLYTVVISDTAGQFAFESAELSDAGRQVCDDLAARLKKDNKAVYLEIEGHTDASGPEEYNMTLGLKRAEAVRRYLSSEHGIPLHTMSVISYGESRPVADNGTREGRAQNRRVEIRVLS